MGEIITYDGEILSYLGKCFPGILNFKARYFEIRLKKLSLRVEGMAKAVWKGKVLAQSGETIIIEGNHYFPPESVNREYFKESSTHTTCFWKGKASYYDIVVEGQVNKDAAWYYPDPKPAAKEIKNYVAFWRGVKVE